MNTNAVSIQAAWKTNCLMIFPVSFKDSLIMHLMYYS